MFKKIFLLIALSLATLTLAAQDKFDYEDIRKGKFSQKSVGGIRSMNDGEHYTVNDKGVILRYGYRTGELIDTVCDTRKLENLKGGISDYTFSSDEDRMMFRFNSRALYRRSAYSQYLVFDRRDGSERLLTTRDSVRHAVFSPAGDKAAFVYGNNIYVSDLGSGKETQVTFDGRFNHIINGMPDWVYEEEFALYDLLRWSPDGKRIAYLRSDESHVKEFFMTYYNRPDDEEKQQIKDGNPAAPLYTRPYNFKYPKAGEANSFVDLYVYDLEDGRTTKIDTGPEKDQYIPFFEWTPDGQLYFFRINRLQNHLEVVLAKNDGSGRVIYEERSPKYIDDISLETITFLPDSKRFIARNETHTGYFHLYMYHVDKGFQYAVTHGEWEVKQMVHAGADRIWFTSNETSPLRTNLYSVNLRGKQKKRLTTQDGIYRIAPGKGCRYYISTFSNSSTPNLVTLHNGDGKLIRTLEDNAKLRGTVAETGLPRKEFFTFGVDNEGETLDLNCWITRPADFDPAKKYPVLITQYSGPGSQQVLDRWGIGWEDVMVQKGYIVASCDPRGTAGMGEYFKKLTYGKLGELETKDQTAFARYLASLDYVDAERIGIYGWSYGGFMALNCIFKGADVFKTAVSVAPVTSWRYYDSIYTERFNGLPEGNDYGYDEVSPLGFAKLLKGNLLIMHGTGDDNVHVQNTYRMVYELVREGRRFDMMVYPDDNHSMVPNGRSHINQKMIDYCLEKL